MALSSSPLLTTNSFQSSLLLILVVLTRSAAADCYTSLFGFGDSIQDTGNLLLSSPSNAVPPIGFPPYGETFFHQPTGRCSDGRIIMDFVAEHLGLPLVTPYLSYERSGNKETGRGGVNFAVVGAPALDAEFYKSRGIHISGTNNSMRIQMLWFKKTLQSLCGTPSSCNELLKSSLILFGPFGGNDYRNEFFEGPSREEALSVVPLVVNAIGSAISELVELGAMNIIVPGLMPDGCLPITLSRFQSSNKEDYDPVTGCLVWLNQFSQYHNVLLQSQLNQVRERHPHASIIYADYYNVVMQLYLNPQQYGFNPARILWACCGGGGPYNVYNSSAKCGNPGSAACDDPSTYINWDGAHPTESANRFISKAILEVEGPFAYPHFNAFCASKSALYTDI